MTLMTLSCFITVERYKSESHDFVLFQYGREIQE